MSTKERKKTRNKSKIKYLLSACIIALMLIFIPEVQRMLGFLQQESRLDNAFEVGKISVDVAETFLNNRKSDVTIQNTGNIDTYIRVAVAFSWQDKNGNLIVGTPVEDVDYEITWGDTINDWIKVGEFYYHKEAVSAGQNTKPIITNCVQEVGAESKSLVVDIAVQSIQADSAAVAEAWSGIKVDESGRLAVSSSAQ